jgi:alkylated DNA nucleotide flippase Atl1
MNRDTQGPFAKSSDFDNWVKAVWHVVKGIPRGHVLTYGEVARLLELEGVVFLNGKIDLQRFGYQGALDQLLWGEPL